MHAFLILVSILDQLNSMAEKRIMHYKSSHRILLVGEGDFSFSACLATAFGSATNMVATTLDSYDSLLMKYSCASKNLQVLEELGCTILHEVDATAMMAHRCLHDKSFDRIVFNFPHAGFQFREHDSLQISLHQEVVEGFLRSAKRMMSEEGEIHITHKTSYPFSEWKIVETARKLDLFLREEVSFSVSDYPNYVNKRGGGWRCDSSFPVGECSTYKFVKRAVYFPYDL